MIDLRFRGLPSCLECDGEEFELDTDFRTWIEFERMLRVERRLWLGIFKGKHPEGLGWIEGAIEFLQSKNVTPREGGSSVRALDYVLDGDYIVAAFQQAYGIDLTSIDYMHWHRFNALIVGLPDETRLAKVMGYRTWVKSDRKYEDEMREMRSRWMLPDDDTGEDEIMQAAAEFFG